MAQIHNEREKQFENMADDGFADWVIAAGKVLEEIRRLISDDRKNR